MGRIREEKKGAIVLSETAVRAQAEAESVLGSKYEYSEQLALAKVEWESAIDSRNAAVKKALSVGMRLKCIMDIEGEDEIFSETCERVGIAERHARDLIAQFNAWGLEPPKSLKDVGTQKMLELTYIVNRLPEEERDELIEHGRLGGEDVNEMGYRAMRKFKTDLLQKEKRILELEKDKSDGAKYIKLLEEDNRRLKADTPKEEEDLLKYLESIFADVERICAKLTEVKLSGIGQRGLLRYASCLEFMRTRPARVLEKQALTTPELAELDIIAPYTEIQNAIITERSVMAQRDPKKAKQLESVSPLTNALDELEPSPSN